MKSRSPLKILKKKLAKPSELRSRIMRAIKSHNTGPEQTVAEWLRSAKIKPDRHSPNLPGRPDFSLRSKKLAIFVHGCFWHGHNCKRGGRAPKTNADYWSIKIATNKRRDARSAKALRNLGWSVITLWECKIESEQARIRLMGRLSRAS
jgi:DNA mismatch endonuclease (patch repair protein)